MMQESSPSFPDARATVCERYSAAVIIIGNEILSGRTQDVNLCHIAERLNRHGIQVTESRIIADHIHTIAETVNVMRTTHDYVFTTGGIGPTHDDMTAKAVAVAFGVAYVCNPKAEKILLDYFGTERATPQRMRMSWMPEGAGLIENPVSHAPGFFMENVYVLAGVPNIMQAMLEKIVPTLASGKPMLSHTLTVHTPESNLADYMEQLERLWNGLEIGSYPFYRDGTLGTSMVFRAFDKSILQRAVANAHELLRAATIQVVEEIPPQADA